MMRNQPSRTFAPPYSTTTVLIGFRTYLNGGWHRLVAVGTDSCHRLRL